MTDSRDLTDALRKAVKNRESSADRTTRVWRASTLLEDVGIPVEPIDPSRSGIAETIDQPHRHTLADSPDAEGPEGDDSALPDRLGRFIPLSEIGVGGMGRVLESWDPELGRRVAIKLIRDSNAVSEDLVRRFIAEARITAQLDHPSIVPVHEMGVTDDGQLFFVMKRVQGESLSEIILRLDSGDEATTRRFGRHRLLTVFVSICNALAYAHERGVLHRDLKPENIMVGEFGEVVVMDWGVARLLTMGPKESDAAPRHTPIRGTPKPRTMHGRTVGTPGFMSPEQAMGVQDGLGPSTDTWSLGAVLYELLTFTPPYIAPTAATLLRQTVDGPPQPPRKRAPGRRIAVALERICMDALDPIPLQRPTARDLARQIQRFLEGHERRTRADDQVEEARTAWQQHAELVLERDHLRIEVEDLTTSTPPWAPVVQKTPLITKRTRLYGIAADIADAFDAVVAGCERALSHDRRNEAAHALLSEAYWFRLGEADKRGDAIAAKHYAGRVRVHDFADTYKSLLDGQGHVSLDTVPRGATVVCRAFDREGLVWNMGPPREIGVTPLRKIELPMGSYLLELVADGYRSTRYPVHLVRGRPWNAVEKIRLFAEGELDDGWIYVPGGPFIEGGDDAAADAVPRRLTHVPGFLIAEVAVTCEEYAQFLNALLDTDPEEAWRRCPREVSGSRSASGQYWPRPDRGARFVFPLEDRDGATWDGRWPVTAVSWDDAIAYARWLSQKTGVLHRLPRAIEWEKAARGVDARAFPWGDVFDASLCRMRDSQPSNKSPCPVGTFASDQSVYGVKDLSGTVSEWCGGTSYRGDATRRIARGGSWMSGERSCRLASRLVLDASYVYQSVGFRLVRELPD